MAAREAISLDEFAQRMNQAATRQRDVMAWVTRATPFILKLMQSAAKKTFHNQASPEGVPWPQLANTRARGSTGHVLRDTGELMASLTGGAGSIGRQDGTSIIFGTALQKGFHNKGGMIQRKNSKFLTIPASKEALYAGGMRNFPRKLRIVWSEAKGKGFAYEMVEKKRPQRSAKANRKAAKRRKLKGWRKLLDRAKKAARKILERLLRKRKKKRAARVKAKKAKGRGGKAKKIMVIHYYLRAWVLVPERKFLGMSQETHQKVGKILISEMFKHTRGES